MKKEIIINETDTEIRIAITEDNRLAELYVETPEKERMVGDIYLGRVANVKPGIRAAFIDIGQKQDAFLHFSDIGNTFSEYSSLIGDDDADVDVDDDGDDDEEPSTSQSNAPGSTSAPQPAVAQPPPRPRPQQPGRDNGRQYSAPDLKKGQDIIVQVTKEPVAKKGVRVTSEVSLPGRFLVLLPFDGKIGISKKMSNFKEKRRLRRVMRSILPPGFGVIVRTVAQEKEEAALKQDLDGLVETWREIEKSLKTERPPALLYKDMATTSSVIRDLFTDSVERVVTDSRKLYKEIRSYVQTVSPQLVEKIELYKEKEPIFGVFWFESKVQIDKDDGTVDLEEHDGVEAPEVRGDEPLRAIDQDVEYGRPFGLQRGLECRLELVAGAHPHALRPRVEPDRARHPRDNRRQDSELAVDLHPQIAHRVLPDPCHHHPVHVVRNEHEGGNSQEDGRHGRERAGAEVRDQLPWAQGSSLRHA